MHIRVTSPSESIFFVLGKFAGVLADLCHGVVRLLHILCFVAEDAHRITFRPVDLEIVVRIVGGLCTGFRDRE